MRDHDGRTRHVERNARTRAGAETTLKLAIRDRVHVGATGDLTPDTAVAVLAESWFAGLKGKAPTTLEAYRTRLDRQVLPGLGALRLRELTVGRADRFLQAVGVKHGPAVAKMCRSVLNGMWGLAARHDVLDRKSVRAAASTASTSKTSPRALMLDEVRTLRSRQAVARDLPDLIDFLLATGVRIGEASAVTWDEVHLGETTTVEVTGTVVRLRRVGLVRQMSLRRWGADGYSCCLRGPACYSGNAERRQTGPGQSSRRPLAAFGTRATLKRTFGRH